MLNRFAAFVTIAFIVTAAAALVAYLYEQFDNYDDDNFYE